MLGKVPSFLPKVVICNNPHSTSPDFPEGALWQWRNQTWLVDVLRRRKHLYRMWGSRRGHCTLFWGVHCETSYYSRLRSQRCKVSHIFSFLSQLHKLTPELRTCVDVVIRDLRVASLFHHSDRQYVLSLRFLQYWGRIGSENNMTSCHRPICRKEGVLLDYSKDGGMFHEWQLCLRLHVHTPSDNPQKHLCRALLTVIIIKTGRQSNMSCLCYMSCLWDCF